MNSNVLITGATSGIGYELAKIFAREGYNLVINSRDQEALQKVAAELQSQYSVTVTPIAKDLSKPEAPEELYWETQNQNMPINILVNNAGMGEYGFFNETDLQKELAIIQLNVLALVSLTKLYLQDMVSRNEGRILQLGSVVSDMPNPLMAVYGATKAFVKSFSEALIEELKTQESNVTITVLQPGATDTDFFNKAGAEHTKAANSSSIAEPAEVAQDGYDALMSGESKVISGFMNKVQTTLSNVMPDEMVAKNMRKQMEPDKE